MKTKEYRSLLKKLNLTVVGAADVLGVSRRQAQRFASDAAIPSPVSKLLQLMVLYKVKPERVIELNG